ncbi:MAG: hypothetical protein WCP89_03595 [archaeon]
MVTASIATLNYFIPIFAFLLVFIIIYALLKKTAVLGDDNFVALFISFILATFFIIRASLVEFVAFSSAWFSVFIVCVFMIMLLIGFTHGKLDVIQKPWLAWVLLVALIVFFVISSAFTFNWAVNWDKVQNWFNTDWFGFVLLLVIAAVVSWVLAKK